MARTLSLNSKILAGIGSCCCCMAVTGGVIALVVVLTAAPAVICSVNEPSYAAVLVKDGPGGDKFTLDNMTVLPPPSLYSSLRAEMNDTWTHNTSGYTYGLAGVHEAPMILYNGTKIAGNWESVPSLVRGVFWMRGNGVPEILATLQYAEWFGDEKILLLPNAPFSWSWYGGAEPPTGADDFAHVYNFIEARSLAEAQGEGNITVAVSFKPCPEDAFCVAGSDNLTFGDVQSHSDGILTSPSVMTSFVTWTMEEMAGVENGSLWYRRVSLYCSTVGFGSYELTKIIDEDGQRIEPYYSEYVQYMEGAPHIIWTGFGEGNHLV
uniref:Uncharacterized protein n=1 Tax=Zooxanthella nutricula TaxID=1333877 RepID=A0A7S2QC30_9DINO